MRAYFQLVIFYETWFYNSSDGRESNKPDTSVADKHISRIKKNIYVIPAKLETNYDLQSEINPIKTSLENLHIWENIFLFVSLPYFIFGSCSS